MSRYLVRVAFVCLVGLPAQVWAQDAGEISGGMVKIGAQLAVFSYSTGTLKEGGVHGGTSSDTIDTSNFGIGVDNTDFGVTLGFTVTKTIELGMTLEFGFEKSELKYQNDTTDTESKQFKILPHLQMNFFPSSFAAIPVRVFGGFRRVDGDSLVSNAGSFGLGVGASLFPFPKGSIDFMLLFAYVFGNADIGETGNQVNADLSGFNLGVSLGMTLWI